MANAMLSIKLWANFPILWPTKPVLHASNYVWRTEKHVRDTLTPLVELN